mmetsp:Transcript_2551/g.6486  ORF Transcript_2551/g.6486 Transcript_2551/m.6486 type:complete len:309 (-) Transcript_2551:1714-2640(-)
MARARYTGGCCQAAVHCPLKAPLPLHVLRPLCSLAAGETADGQESGLAQAAVLAAVACPEGAAGSLGCVLKPRCLVPRIPLLHATPLHPHPPYHAAAAAAADIDTFLPPGAAWKAPCLQMLDSQPQHLMPRLVGGCVPVCFCAQQLLLARQPQKEKREKREHATVLPQPMMATAWGQAHPPPVKMHPPLPCLLPRFPLRTSFPHQPLLLLLPPGTTLPPHPSRSLQHPHLHPQTAHSRCNPAPRPHPRKIPPPPLRPPPLLHSQPLPACLVATGPSLFRLSQPPSRPPDSLGHSQPLLLCLAVIDMPA